MKRLYLESFPEEIPIIRSLSSRYMIETNITMSRGIVDLASKVDDTGENLYAIKNCNFNENNKKEAMILSRLEHPNIMKALDVFIV